MFIRNGNCSHLRIYRSSWITCADDLNPLFFRQMLTLKTSETPWKPLAISHESSMLAHGKNDTVAPMIDYANLMHRAMRGLIRSVLSEVAQDGLPGEHHFLITFDTSHADVEMAEWLRDRYPDQMMIVMQHWFDDLNVGDDGFAVTLNFGDNPERLSIPYESILTFVDPYVEFGLRFEATEEGDEIEIEDDMTEVDAVKPTPGEDAEIVSLDNFRK